MSGKLLILHHFADDIREIPGFPKDAASFNDSALSLIFKDPRPKGSMQLTPVGWALLKDKYPYWSCELKQPLLFSDHGFLFRACVYPYFLESSKSDGSGVKFSTFDPSLGMMVKFTDGDFSKLKHLFP